MKTQLATLAALIAAAFSVSAPAQAQDVKRSTELQVLDHFVGTWDVKVVVKPAGEEEVAFDAASTRSWSQRGTFIHFDDSSFERPQEPEFHMLLTYDPEVGNYPGVMMTGPSRDEITGTWDEKSKTMSFESTLRDGTKMSSTHRFVGADRAEAAGVFRNAAGDVVMKISWNQTKRSKKNLGAVPTVDELIASYHKAIGGLEANRKLTTRRSEGVLLAEGAPEPFKMTFIQKAPNLVYSKVDIPNFGAAAEGHDGKVAWKNNPAEGTVELKGAELAQKLRDYQFHKYLDLKSEFKTLTSVGRETREGNSYDVLAVTREDGSRETLYFDARTHLVGMVERPDLTLEMSDYRKTDGVPVPHLMTVYAPTGQSMFSVKFESVKHGIEVDDALFSPPKE